MRMDIKKSGISETVALLGSVTKEGKSARRAAVKDVGNYVKKELQATRRSGTGLKPLGIVSKKLGNRKPWGKKKFVVYVPKNQKEPVAIITTKGANKKMEYGGSVKISEKFKKFLRFKGIYLKKSTNILPIPARPLFSVTWSRISNKIVAKFNERFHYQLGRSIRRWRYA